MSPQEHLCVLNEDPVDLQFNQSGYLFLASEEVAHIMEENYSTQRCFIQYYCVISESQISVSFFAGKCPINLSTICLAL